MYTLQFESIQDLLGKVEEIKEAHKEYSKQLEAYLIENNIEYERFSDINMAINVFPKAFEVISNLTDSIITPCFVKNGVVGYEDDIILEDNIDFKSTDKSYDGSKITMCLIDEVGHTEPIKKINGMDWLNVK